MLMTIVCIKSMAFVQPNSLFSNNMILQRGEIVPVWGTANTDEKITVEFNGQKVSTVAKDGKWMVKLKQMRASNKPLTMTITGENTVKIENILVGEVWVCSGQSNMEKVMGFMKNQPTITNSAYEIANANYPQIRQYKVPKKFSSTAITDANAKWDVCDTNSVKLFSAVAYFFAKKLFEEKNIPIGIILSAVGGTHIESWINKDELKGEKSIEELYDIYLKSYTQKQNELLKFQSDSVSIISQWENDSSLASTNSKTIPVKPIAPALPPKEPTDGALFNGMIMPLRDFPIAGFVWYQGESDRSLAKQYNELFPLLINSWRKFWGDKNIPFLFVQLPQFKTIGPEIREAQLATYKNVKRTAMVVSLEYGDINEIHPPNKKPIGERLAICANALKYGSNNEYMGPIFESFKVINGKIEISFSHIGSGLIAKDGNELTGFMISGPDKKFYTAKAVIVGNKVQVSSDKVTNPTNVRLGWSNDPEVNLFNKEGFLASPFRTDFE